MAEAEQDPIALLERICRLESTMDASMAFEEDEPTVRMGQDGFALALTQAKLSRLEVPRRILHALTRPASTITTSSPSAISHSGAASRSSNSAFPRL